MTHKVVNLKEKLSAIGTYWSPHIVGELNDQQVKLARLRGEFIWHSHENEDELFLVLEGSLTIEFRNRKVTLNPGEFIIVPRGVEHKPVAENEVHVLLFEPATIINTGNIRNDLTRTDLDRI